MVMTKIKNIFKDFAKQIKSIPVVVLTIFSVTVVVMNLLATKTIYQNEFIAIDGGIILMWLVVVLSDLVTTVKGPKATISMTVFGIIVNLVASLVFYFVSLIPGTPNFDAFKQVLGGSIFIIISSTISFICSSTLNAFLNHGIHSLFTKNYEGKLAFSICCQVSTLVSQILDNFLFNILAYVLFAPLFLGDFKWSVTQCILCALLYAAIEMVIELVLLPVLYKIYRFWSKKEKEEN